MNFDFGKPGILLEGAWKSFEAACIIDIAGPTQRAEMKKAFFGGATVVMAIAKAIGDLDLPEEVGAVILDSLDKEILKFAHNLPDNGPGGPTDEPVHTSH